jgi:F0F1-type ATP synthase membrane subunit b/b'
MWMGSQIRLALAAALLFWPATAFATESEQAGGSWYPLIFYAVNFLLFLWIVRRYGWPGIIQFFRDHSRNIREIRSRLEKAYQDAQELAKRAAQQLELLESDKRKLMAELDFETNHQVGQISQAAREAINRIRHDTEITRVALRDGAQRRLRETMAEAAGKIARELLIRNFRASDQARLLESFIGRMGEEVQS